MHNADHIAGIEATATHLFMESGTPVSTLVAFAAAVFRLELSAVRDSGDFTLWWKPGGKGYVVIETLADGDVSETVFAFGGIELGLEAFVESCRSVVLHKHIDARIAYNDTATVGEILYSSQECRVVTVAKPPVPSLTSLAMDADSDAAISISFPDAP